MMSLYGLLGMNREEILDYGKKANYGPNLKFKNHRKASKIKEKLRRKKNKFSNHRKTKKKQQKISKNLRKPKQHLRKAEYWKRKAQTNLNSAHVKQDKITDKYDQLVFGKTEEQLEYQLSPCCNPIAGDEVFGFVTISDGVKIHKNECPNALTLRSNYAYRIVNAKWIDSSQNEFTAKLNLTGLDDLGLVNKVTQVISNTNNVNISQMSFDSNDGTFEGNILLKVKNTSLLKKMIKQLQNINGVDKVIRE